MRVKPIAFCILATVPLLLAACFGGGGSKKEAVDDTSRDISNEELAQMVLALADFGPDFLEFQVSDDNGFVTAEQKAEDDFDPEDEARDLEEFGWAAGYSQDFVKAAAVEKGFGLFIAGTDVDLYETPEGAAGYFDDTQAELGDMEGQTSEGFTVEEIRGFEADVADEAVGFRMSGSGQDDDGSPFSASLNGVAFRHGRIIGVVSFGALGEIEAKDKLRELARTQDERIASVLAGTAVHREPPAPEPLVSNAVETLGASAERFAEEVQSVQGDMEMHMEFGGLSMDATAEFAFQLPDQMHMTMRFSGEVPDEESGGTIDLSELGSMEMLLLGTDIYMKMPFLADDWMVFSLEDMGVDGEGFQDLVSNHSPIDYQAMVEQLGAEVEDLGQESLDGGTYTHYRATVDMAEAMKAFEETLGTTSFTVPGGFGGPMVIDMWIEAESLLPYKMTMTGEFGVEGEAMAFDATMRFHDYNQPVEIPGPPANAQPFDPFSFTDGAGG